MNDIIKCEKCQKSFSRDFALQMHLMTGKKHSSQCYQYYLLKYEDEKQFPTRPFSKNKQGSNSICCESCNRNYRNMSQHFNYNGNCYLFYKKKYGDDEYFPVGVFKDIGRCVDCGTLTAHPNSKYCRNCYSKYLPQVTSSEFRNKMSDTVLRYYQNPENKLKNKNAQIKSFKEKPWLAENQRKYMLNGGAIKALSGNKIISKPQQKLFDIIKQIYPDDDVVMNYPIAELNILLDIAIPSKKLNFEYDGSYWHQDLLRDQTRDLNLKELGYKIYRFRDYIPTKEVLMEVLING